MSPNLGRVSSLNTGSSNGQAEKKELGWEPEFTELEEIIKTA
jgi:hypothetical protein